ncbi:MAG TPA: hypothetical protein VE864_14355, partial [Streptosporangiaceae bacterium]|nr:hypothetical protein [Streptosporangiaceae bacterium]
MPWPSPGCTGSRSRRSGIFSISGQRSWASTSPWSSPTTRSRTPGWLDQIASMRCSIVLAAFETIWLPVVNQPDF